MSTRMYLVALTRKKVLVEAVSQEAAIKAATRSMVKSVTIPTPLETARLMRDEVEVISPSLPPVERDPPAEPLGENAGVGRMGLQDGDDSGGQQSDGDC